MLFSATAPEPEVEKPEGPETEGDFDSEGDEENLSLSMLEEKLKPQVMETLKRMVK